MKTLLVVSLSQVNKHVGEEIDDYIEVEDAPDTYSVREWAHRIMNRIRGLWNDDGDDPKCVVCHQDASAPYVAILIELQAMMREQEGIIIELPWKQQEEMKDGQG